MACRILREMFKFPKILFFLIVLFILLPITVSPVSAHGEGDGGVWNRWSWLDVPVLALLITVYSLGLRSLWKRAGIGVGISKGRVTAFGAGTIVLFVALVSPLDALSEELFSIHMIQHLLLMLVAAPLLVVGRFPLAWAWAFPARWTSKVWREWKWKPIWKFLTRPVTACLLHAASIWTWHMPRLYEASLRSEWIHFLQHASFFLAALLFWQVFADLTGNLRAGGSAKFGLGIFSIFATAFVNGFLGVLIAFSPFVWYPLYNHETALYGLTALEDQQLGGTIMWVPAGLVYLASALSVMGRWLFAMEALENS